MAKLQSINNLKILHISEYYPPFTVGGAEISASSLNAEIAKSQHILVVTTKHTDKSWNQEGVEVYPLLYPLTPKLVNSVSILQHVLISPFIFAFINSVIIFKFMRRRDFNIINIEVNTHLFFPLVFVMSLMKKTVVLSIRDANLVCPNGYSKGTCLNEDPRQHHCLRELLKPTHLWPWYYEVFRIVYAFSRYSIHSVLKRMFVWLINHNSSVSVITTSQFLQRTLTLIGIDQRKIHIIPSSYAEVHSPVVQTRNWGRFSFAGRIEQEKGVFLLIEAFRLLQDKYPEIELYIAGTGTRENEVRQTIKDSKNIFVLGKTSYGDVLKLYASSLAIVAPSLWPEPFGRFCLESFQTGTPLITTKLGGPAEMITHNLTGKLLTSFSAIDLMKEMEELYLDHQLWQKIVNHIETIKPSYDLEKVAQQRIELLRNLIVT